MNPDPHVVRPRTAQQFEFKELCDRLRDERGMKHAQIARELGISRGAVSTFYKGGSDRPNPSERTLKQLRGMLEKKGGEKERRDSAVDDLLYLKEAAPPMFKGLKLMIKQAAQQTKASSGAGPSGKGSLDKISEEVAKEAAKEELGLPEKESEPSERKRGRHGDAGGGLRSQRKPGV